MDCFSFKIHSFCFIADNLYITILQYYQFSLRHHFLPTSNIKLNYLLDRHYIC